MSEVAEAQGSVDVDDAVEVVVDSETSADAMEESATAESEGAVDVVEDGTTVENADESEAPVGAEDAPADDAAAVASSEEASAESTAAEAVEGEPEAEAAVEPTPASPYDLPGDWYVIHSYSGYENKVKANLETRIQSMHMEDRIFEVHIPMEDVVEFKGGKKVTVPKKVFPGYILVRMSLEDDSWYAVRNTPGVTGFVAGNAQKPTPLSRREVERFLGVKEEDEKAKPRFKPEWEVGEQVRVVTGPFADFNGVIEEINVDQQKVVVLVNIFGRDTPVELGFQDIQKN